MAIQNKIDGFGGAGGTVFKAPSTRRSGGGSFGTTPKARANAKKANAQSKAAKRSTVRKSTTVSKPVSQVQRQTGNMPRITSSSSGQVSRTATPVAMAGPNLSSGASISPTVAPQPAAPPPPSIEAFLASDDAWDAQNTAINNALADYLAQMKQQQSQYEGSYNDQLRDLGLSEQQSLTDNTNDFAGRGLLMSGLYDEAGTEIGRDFNNRRSDMASAKGNFLENLQTGHTNFQREQELVRQNARREAVARRAAQYGL